MGDPTKPGWVQKLWVEDSMVMLVKTFIKDNSKVCCLHVPESLDQLHLLEEAEEGGPYHQGPKLNITLRAGSHLQLV